MRISLIGEKTTKFDSSVQIGFFKDEEIVNITIPRSHIIKELIDGRGRLDPAISTPDFRLLLCGRIVIRIS